MLGVVGGRGWWVVGGVVVGGMVLSNIIIIIITIHTYPMYIYTRR